MDTYYNLLGVFMKSKWIPDCICPICEKHQFEDSNDICPVCFWENDGYQYDEPDFGGGANNLSLNDYKQRWDKLTKIMPALMNKYKALKTNLSQWEYDQLYVPRENIKEFVNNLTEQNIGIELSFYNICEKYGYDDMSFIGYPLLKDKTIAGGNNESLDIVFSKNPIETCKEYKLKQVLEILEKNASIEKSWEKLTPYISIEPNPKEV